jgi:hypothetical protein
VLYPVTQVRVTLLLRDTAMPQDISAVAEDVSAEVWQRRAELAERAPAALSELRARFTELQRIGGLRGQADLVASALGFAAFWLFGAALWNTLQRVSRHQDLLSALGRAVGPWIAFVVLLVLWRAARQVMRWVSSDAARRRRDWYQLFMHGGLAAEIKAMADEIWHRAYEPATGVLLQQLAAPSLVEFERASVVQSQSFRDVLTLISTHITSAIGIAGTRGAGKSTLLRLLCGDDGANGRIGVYLAAPMSSAEGDFVKVIYATTVRQVLSSRAASVGSYGGWRRRLRLTPDNELTVAERALERITGSTSRTRQGSLGVSPASVSVSVGGQRTWTERDLSHADWVAEFRDYLEHHRQRGGGQILVAIDELDKIADAGQAIEVINGLKDLFHVQGAHFVVSVSDDALRSFATRGIPVRDAFDSSFDTVLEIPQLTALESCGLLRARVPLFPDAVALFCHAWSGGVPRELIRVARSCVAVPRTLERSVPVTDIAARIVRRDVTEFVDAMIRGTDQAQATMEPLLRLRHRLAGDSASLRDQLTDPDTAGQPALTQFLRIAVAVSEYFSVPRDSRQWADGIASGEFQRDADLLAQARAGLAIHPSEAAWRLDRALAVISPVS